MSKPGIARKPSVAIVHFTCPPIVGGVESVIAATAKLLADRAYPVRLLVGRGGQFDPRIPVTVIPRLDSKHPELLELNQELDCGLVTPRFQQYAADLIQSLRPALAGVDVCIIHNAFTLHFNLPLTLALRMLVAEAGARFIAWCHDLSWTNALYLPKMREAEPWSLLKTPYPGVQYLVVSQERQRELATLFDVDPATIPIVPNGVDPARFLKLAPETERLVAAHDLFCQDLVLLLPARITARKNIELAIEVVAALKAQGLQVKLLVTGPPGPHNVSSGDYLDKLLELRRQLNVENEVAFLYADTADGGGVSERVVSDLYDVSDALFFPSAQEGFGIPLLEAGLARLPVFCSRIPALQEVGGPNVNFFSLGDAPEAIARQVLIWCQESKTHLLRKSVTREFTWPAIFQNIVEPLLNNVNRSVQNSESRSVNVRVK